MHRQAGICTHRIQGNIRFPEFLDRFIGWDFLTPQIHWIRSYSGEIPLDFIGRFERLQEDFHHVCQVLGMPSIQLPHALKSNQAHFGRYQDHYDDRSIELVARTYHEEIELFGYAFEPPHDGASSEAG